MSPLHSKAAALFEMQSGVSRLRPMEGLRGMSALLVFFVHFYYLFESHVTPGVVKRGFFFLATLGHCGVDVFFALSGFIIYGLLIEKPFHYVEFVRRRIKRLYPAFTAVFLLYLLISLIQPTDKLPSSWFSTTIYLAANYLMLPGIFPIIPFITVAWSLSYELCFYLILPLVIRGLHLAGRPRTTRILFIVAACAAHLALSSAGIVGHARMVMFGCGILLRETISWRVAWGRIGNLAALAVFAAALGFTGLTAQPVIAQYCGPVISNSGVRLCFLFVATYALMYFTLGEDGLLAKWFGWDWLRWMGNISYTYYLVHGLILHICKVALDATGLRGGLPMPAFLGLCGVTLAATVIGAAGAFLAVEKRFSFRRAAPPKAVRPAPEMDPNRVLCAEDKGAR